MWSAGLRGFSSERGSELAASARRPYCPSGADSLLLTWTASEWCLFFAVEPRDSRMFGANDDCSDSLSS